MTDLSQEAAGLPAPFDSLEPLKRYIALLEQVVADPSPANLATYVAYDRDVFTPVVVLFPEYGHSNRHVYGRLGFRSCILHDGIALVVRSENPSNDRLRNAARVVVHGVVSGLTESCAFPYEESREAYELIDAAFKERAPRTHIHASHADFDNYLREHDWNLWFVLTGPSREHLDQTLDTIEQITGLKPLDLPMLTAYQINLGFALGKDSQVPT